MRDFFVPRDMLLCGSQAAMPTDFSVRGFGGGLSEASATLTVTVSSGVEIDQYWASVVSLLQPAATDQEGSTAIVDAKGKTLTLNGVTCVKTTLGFPAFYFDGLDNSIVLDSHTDFAFGTGDLTVDLLIYPLAYGVTVCGASFWGTTNGGTSGYVFNLGQNQDSMRLTSNMTGVWADNLIVSLGGGPALNSMSHIAMERYGDTLTLYKNGAIVAQRTGVSAWHFAQNKIVIGRFWDGENSRYLNGYVRAIRATRTARWRGIAFTGNVPTYPFPTA